MTRTTVTPDHHAFRNALTVRELIKQLADCEPDAVVVFKADYGDYNHTDQALPVEVVEELGCEQVLVEERGYSRSGVAFAEMDEGELEEGLPPGAQKFVFLW